MSGSRTFRVVTTAAEFTRPANTTAYAALDAISDSTTAPNDLEFTGLGAGSAGGGKITKVKVLTDQATNTSAYRLHLFSAAPTPVNDNDPQTLLYANRATWLGSITTSAAAPEGTGSTAAWAVSPALNFPFKCAADSQTVYGMLQTVGGFTPASGQKFYIELTAETEF